MVIDTVRGCEVGSAPVIRGGQGPGSKGQALPSHGHRRPHNISGSQPRGPIDSYSKATSRATRWARSGVDGFHGVAWYATAVLICSAAVLSIVALMLVATGGLVTAAAKSGRATLTLMHRVSDAERARRRAGGRRLIDRRCRPGQGPRGATHRRVARRAPRQRRAHTRSAAKWRANGALHRSVSSTARG